MASSGYKAGSTSGPGGTVPGVTGTTRMGDGEYENMNSKSYGKNKKYVECAPGEMAPKADNFNDGLMEVEYSRSKFEHENYMPHGEVFEPLDEEVDEN